MKSLLQETQPRSQAPALLLRELWEKGKPPTFKTWVKAQGDLPALDLVDLILVDFEHRLALGQNSSVSEYIKDFPELEQDDEAVVELIYGEYLHFEKKGAQPDLSTYQARYPKHAERLALQVEFHQAMGEAGLDNFGSDTSYQPKSASAEGKDPTATRIDSDPSATLAGTKEHSTSLGWSQAPPGYELLERIGRGGMAVVHKARQVTLGRLVALKMIRSGSYASIGDIARFRREAEAVASLRHPNIVQIHEIGEHQGQPYLCLEYVAGGTLAQQINGSPQSPRKAAQMVETLARAMQFAHEHKLIHRDLKPSNIFLSEDGSPKVGDFGLVKRLRDADTEESGSLQTETGHFLGTPSYMATEQAQPSGPFAAEIGPPTDVYALGAILYETLTGRPPFLGASPSETMLQVIQDDVVPPSKLVRGLPTNLETICLKCLSKHAKNRYQTALDLANDLELWQEGKPITARRATLLERSWRFCLRNPALATLGAIAALLFLVVLIGAPLVAWDQAQKANDISRQSDDIARQASNIRNNYVQAKLDEARSHQLARHEGQRSRSLKAIKDVATLASPEKIPDFRDAALASLVLPDLAESPLKTIMFDEKKGIPIVNMDQGLIAYLEKKQLIIERFPQGQELHGKRLVTHSIDAGQGSHTDELLFLVRAGFNKKGDYFYFLDNQMPGLHTEKCLVWKLGPSEAETKLVANLTYKKIHGAALDQRDPYLVMLHDNKLEWFSLGTEKSTKVPFPAIPRIALSSGYQPFALNPDRTRLATGAYTVFQMFDLHKPPVPTVLIDRKNASQNIPWRFEWSPDGRFLAVLGIKHQVEIWDHSAITLHTVLTGHGEEITHAQFLPNMPLILTGSRDGTTRLWELTQGRLLLTMKGALCGVSKDGKTLALRRGPNIEVRRLELSSECRSLSMASPQYYYLPNVSLPSPTLCFHPSDGWTACHGRGGGFFFDFVHMQIMAPRNLNSNISTFSNDGSTLWTTNLKTLYEIKFENVPNHAAKTIKIKNIKTIHSMDPSLGFSSMEISQNRQVLVMSAIFSPRIEILKQSDTKFQLIHTIRLNERLSTLSLCPNGRWIATLDMKGVGGIYETDHGQVVKEWSPDSIKQPPAGKPLCSFLFSPDGHWLARMEPDQVRLFKTGTWKEHSLITQKAFRPTEGMMSWSSDGQMIAVADSFNQIMLINPQTGTKLGSLDARDHPTLLKIAFSPDNRFIVATAMEGELIVWDLPLLRQNLQNLDIPCDWPSVPEPRDPASWPRVNIIQEPVPNKN